MVLSSPPQTEPRMGAAHNDRCKLSCRPSIRGDRTAAFRIGAPRNEWRHLGRLSDRLLSAPHPFHSPRSAMSPVTPGTAADQAHFLIQTRLPKAVLPIGAQSPACKFGYQSPALPRRQRRRSPSPASRHKLARCRAALRHVHHAVAACRASPAHWRGTPRTSPQESIVERHSPPATPRARPPGRMAKGSSNAR